MGTFALAWYIVGVARALRGSKPNKVVEYHKLGESNGHS